MKTPTYREQYDKIVGAYLRNELDPSDCWACFVGNLLNNTGNWARGRDVYSGIAGVGIFNGFEEAVECVLTNSNGLYTLQEVATLERKFLDILMIGRLGGYNSAYVSGVDGADTYEDRLFNAMETTLVSLRELHESKGEVIEDYVFQKRELVKA